MNKSLKSSLKSYDKEVDTRSLYHTTIGIFMTRDQGGVSVNVWMDTVTSDNTRQLSIINSLVVGGLVHLFRLGPYWDHITPVMQLGINKGKIKPLGIS